MRVRQYEQSDYETLLRWYQDRNLTCPKPTAFPKVGVIAPGIAVGFLMQTDTSCAILEPFASNPKRRFETRDRALLEIMDSLTGIAKDLGYARVFGFSNNGLMVFRAQQLGFTITERMSTTVFKELT